MGREIRRVPKGWEHPRNDEGKYIPMHDEDYDSVSQEWLQKLLDWEADKDGERTESGVRWLWEWDGGPPDREGHRPKFESEPTHYQIYETVSEGTPSSPVFETEEEIVAWLIEKAYTEKAASTFVEKGWAPSGMMIPSAGFMPGIQAYDPEAVKSGEMHMDLLRE